MTTTKSLPRQDAFRAAAIRLAITALFPLTLAGCDPLSLTMLGLGSSLGVSHHLGGFAYRTFTEPMPRVKRATLVALHRMAITVSDTTKTTTGELIKATAENREIEIEIESLSPSATRVRAVARKDGGFFVDAATAVEIITQTERVLGV